MENKDYYCEKCRTKMGKEWVSASEYNMLPYLWLDTRYPKFDRETGEKLLIKQYACPEAKWWKVFDWGHSKFAIGKPVLESEIDVV